MSYLNINYSTLEDAWGRNFEKKHNKKSNSKDLCNLYNKRNSEIYKPYKTTQAPSYIKPIYSDEDYTKYYGYKDGRPFSRKHRNIAKYKVDIPFTKPGSYQSPIISNNYISDEDDDDHDDEVVVKKNTRKCKREPYIQTPFSYIDNDTSDFRKRTSKYPILVQQEDDDDDYENYTQANMSLEQPDIDDSNPHLIESSNKFENTNNKFLYEIDYDDDFDGYFESSSFSPDEIETSFDKEYMKNECNEEDMYNSSKKYTQSDNEYDKIVKSTLRETYTDPPTPLTKSNKSVRSGIIRHKSIQEKIHFDLALYTVSGIILIFIMEQFIQIGMKIKNV